MCISSIIIPTVCEVYQGLCCCTLGTEFWLISFCCFWFIAGYPASCDIASEPSKIKRLLTSAATATPRDTNKITFAFVFTGWTLFKILIIFEGHPAKWWIIRFCTIKRRRIEIVPFGYNKKGRLSNGHIRCVCMEFWIYRTKAITWKSWRTSIFSWSRYNLSIFLVLCRSAWKY